MRTRFPALVAALLTGTLFAGEIQSVSPTGSVKNIQQITVRFTTDMVALGDPSAKSNSPFTLECKVAKEAKNPAFTTRWADTKNWVLDFEQPLASGVHCKLTFKAETKDLVGGAITGMAEYNFSTSGPGLLGISPKYGDIEPLPYFILLTDGPVNLVSVEQTAYLEVQDIPEKVRLKNVSDKNRLALIEAAVRDNWSWNHYKNLFENKKKNVPLPKGALDNFLILTPVRRLPESRAVVFHWPKGILSASGLPSEEEQHFEFKVIPPFEAHFSCQRTAAERPCNPILNLGIDFTRRVALKALTGAKLQSSSGATWIPEELKKGDLNKNISGTLSTKKGIGFTAINNFADAEVSSLTFKAPFPEKTKFTLVLPAGIKDEIGRKLVNQSRYPLEVSTDEYSPLIKFSGRFGILEANGDPVLPVSVRNIEKQVSLGSLSLEAKSLSLSSLSKAKEIIDLYEQVQQKDEYDARNTPVLSTNQGTKFTLPKPSGEREFELMGIPLKKNGFYVVEIASPKLGAALTEKGTMYVPTTVLVTNLAVNFKKGRESSLAWVTQLDSGKPSVDTEVVVMNRDGKELARGKTKEDGAVDFKKISYPCQVSGGEEGEGSETSSGCQVYVFAKKGEDISFLSTSWEQGIESYRFNVPIEDNDKNWGPVHLHTVLNRVVAQPGNKIEMKHYIRIPRSNGFSLPSNEKLLPKQVLVVHSGTNKTFSFPFKYDKASGTALTEFILPKNASLGYYTVQLTHADTIKEDEEAPYDWTSRQTADFIVSEYRLPLMKATVKIKGTPLIQPSSAALDLSASYLSGGPASGLPVKLRSTLSPGYFSPDIPNASQYSFFSDPIKAGVQSTQTNEEEKFLAVQSLKLSKEGGLAASLKKIPAIHKVTTLTTEMEYTDPNGEIRTASASTPLFPGEWIVGLTQDNWYTEPGKVRVSGVVADPEGKIQPRKPFTVYAFKTNYLTHRKRLVGGFYSYDSKVVNEALGKVCEGASDELGRFVCAPKDLPAGSILLEARVEDSKKRTTYANVSMSVYEKGTEQWYTPSDSDRIDLIPLKTHYAPGEKAKLFVASPFSVATALVTVEREGVLSHFVTEVKRDNPSIEISIEGNYAPNVFVSAVLVRGRVDSPKATALVDLARPAMKMALTKIVVDWKAHELNVTVKTPKSRYQARDNVTATVNVKTASGRALPAQAEVAFAVVDEALLRFRENLTWKLLDGIMGERSLAVFTSSAQNQVIGRRHFGSKAKAPGGGGGALEGNTRELFEPVLAWFPRVKLDKEGNAKVSFKLNDSLTRFRIVAVAHAGSNLFGTGKVEIESTKDLILYSGFAPSAHEGDQIQNKITIRNTTAKPMKVEIKAEGVKGTLSDSSLDLKASEAKTVTLSLTVPRGVTEIPYTLAASDSISGAKDSFSDKIRVEPAVPVKVTQATLFQLENKNSLSVKQPAGAIEGSGGLKVNTSASLVTGLAGVATYLESYPYSCLEQKISRAVGLQKKEEIQSVVDALPNYFDDSGLLKFFPSSICGDAMLTRYALEILAANEFSLPAATKTRAVEGLKNWLNGNTSCKEWWDSFARNTYANEKKLLALETLSRWDAFSPDQLTAITINPLLWKTETLVAWYRLLKKESAIPKRNEYLSQARKALRARLNFQGSLMNLQGELDWEGSWQLFSSRDQEAIGVLGIATEEPEWKEDVGRVLRGVMARQRQGIWDTTLADAWGATYVRQFSKIFESEKLKGVTVLTAGELDSQVSWTKESQKEVFLPWPKASLAAPVALQWEQKGSGKPWVLLQTLSAIPLTAPADYGYKIGRKVTGVVKAKPGRWTVGDVANVEVTVTAKADQPWVVVNDSIPAGASHLGTGLQGSSEILDKGGVVKPSNDVKDWPKEFEEKPFSRFISYASYLPRGVYRLNYRIRLNAAGTFVLPPTHVEAMYSPESFGDLPHEVWTVAP